MDELFKVYTGGARRGFVYGVPARSLTRREYDKLPDHLRSTVDNSKLYRNAPAKRNASEPTQSSEVNDG